MEKNGKVTKIRNRQEIVEKIEEVYKLIRENKMEVLRGIVITDALCWVLGDDYLCVILIQRFNI